VSGKLASPAASLLVADRQNPRRTESGRDGAGWHEDSLISPARIGD